MAMESYGQNWLDSLTGHAEKAIITIFDTREGLNELREIPPENPNNQGNAQPPQNNPMNALDGQGVDVALKKYKVRFNPSTLSLTATGGGYYPKTKYNGNAGQNPGSIEYGELATQLQLSCELIFDDYSYGDAFMNPTANLSMQNMIGKVTDLGSHAKNKKDHPNVQDHVEAFTAAIRNKNTRTVEFAWGKMSFKGEMNRFDATYTMFNLKGYPIRAKVQFGMVMLSEGGEDAQTATWSQWYGKLFGGDNDADFSSSAANPMDYVKNLLNLKI